MSEAAHDLLTRYTKSEWIKETMNEHPEPLKLFWAWIRDNCNSISPYEIAMRFHQYPMVTITKEEDKSLSQGGYRSKGTPLQRYGASAIRVITINEHPADIFSKNHRRALLAKSD